MIHLSLFSSLLFLCFINFPKKLVSVAETQNNSVSASMPSRSPPQPPKQEEPAVMNMEVEASGAATPPPPPPQPIAVTTENKKKKRGRPMKYDSNRNLILTSPPNAEAWTMTMSFSPSPPPPPSHSEFGEAFAVVPGGGFTPHLVNVFAGEDIAGKIMSFVEMGPRAVFVLSAKGAISNATIRRSANSAGLWTYEGRFEILSLTGSYVIEEIGAMRIGGLNVVLAGSGDNVFGGVVAGLLTRLGPVQLVVGSFRPHAPKRKHRREHTTSQLVVAAPIAAGPTDTMAATSLATQANPEESKRECAAATCNGSEEFPDQRISPDINISLSYD